jgi:hypothetical protein
MSTDTVNHIDLVSETETQNQQSNVAKKGTRSFKVKLEQTGPQYGRYNGDSPYQAANKALSEIIRNRVKNNLAADQDISFFLVESTKGSGKKHHQYVGKRVKLTSPVTYTVDNGQVITKEFKNILRKVKKVELSTVQEGGAETQTTQTTPTSTTPVDV